MMRIKLPKTVEIDRKTTLISLDIDIINRVSQRVRKKNFNLKISSHHHHSNSQLNREKTFLSNNHATVKILIPAAYANNMYKVT